MPPLSLLHSIAAQINSVDPDQQVSSFTDDLERVIARQPEWQQENLVAWLFGCFAVLALALAAVGLYSVVSYIVAQRTNEFGIRMALGAQRATVVRMVLRQGMKLALLGVAIGLALALGASQLLGSLLFGVGAADPITFVGAAVLFCAIGLAACYAPARRATEIDAMEALRYE